MGKSWICTDCHRKLRRGTMPTLCSVNTLHLKAIPPELSCLNLLETQLISAHIAFRKWVALPRGGQNGVHGPVTCVPANITATTHVLPRSDDDDSLLRVHLKRKMSYTANYSYQYVSVQRIKKALLWLQAYNPYYADILFNTEWLNRYEQDVKQQPPDEHTQPEEACVDEEPSHDRQTHGMFMDTCLQPVDLGQEILDR